MEAVGQLLRLPCLVCGISPGYSFFGSPPFFPSIGQTQFDLSPISLLVSVEKDQNFNGIFGRVRMKLRANWEKVSTEEHDLKFEARNPNYETISNP